jgi:mRNA interferase HicA
VAAVYRVSKARHNIFVAIIDDNGYVSLVNAGELKRLLAKQGCTFENHKGGSGHLTVIYVQRKSQLPLHGGKRELGTGLVNKIKKDLGLEW